jgi:hypothetical protein
MPTDIARYGTAGVLASAPIRVCYECKGIGIRFRLCAEQLGQIRNVRRNAPRFVAERRASSHLHLLSLAWALHFIRQS